MYESYLVEIRSDHVDGVIELLQSFSVYKPKDYVLVWNAFQLQQNSCGLVAINADNKVFGYGCVSFHTNIRGGKIGFIDDIVVAHNYRKKELAQ